MDKNSKPIPDIDVNAPAQIFYNEVQAEIESDLARMKKCIEVILHLRLTTAELEVETAALYHAEIWHDMRTMDESAEISSDEDDDVPENTQSQSDEKE